MTTSAFDVVQSIDLRIAELNLLVSAARSNMNNPDLYDAICRSTGVLIASHLEGFVKDFSRSVIADLNFFGKTFSNMPKPLKRAFCHKIVFYEAYAVDSGTSICSGCGPRGALRGFSRPMISQ
jgi:hypothetical protein